MTPRIPIALLSAAALALGAAACGSSSSGSSNPGSPSASGSGGASGTVNGAGSTFAAPVYQQWGADLKSQGITVNFRPGRLRRRRRALAAGTAAFAGSDPALAPEDRATLKKGSAVQIPMCLRRDHRLLQRRAARPRASSSTARRWPTSSWARSRPGTTRRSPSSTPASSSPATTITVVHRSDESGTTKGFTTFLSVRQPGVEELDRRGQDRQVADRHRRQGQRRRRRDHQETRAARSATSSRPTPCRTASPTPTSRTARATSWRPTLESTSAAGDRRDGSRRPRHQHHQRAGRPGLPDRLADVLDVYRDPCKAGVAQGEAKALKAFLDYGARRLVRTRWASCSSPRSQRRCWPRPRPPPRRCPATGARSSSLHGDRGDTRLAAPTAARSPSGRRRARLPDRAPALDPHGAGGGRSSR